ncbi:hypothetical protein J7E50_02740 [Pedobacter sp. ISL-68]|uniref:hypothetical protein n=1 Tax=unclassified Pedobacter TaxID=2628915 RepID=UPI001BE53BE3|nr:MULTISPECIES: hypothetical protein [unclassified Pedobacter]MBT2560137.1 hypothetical protein [Pedobacter sp. ISL-64]MBT2589116.1 hypothetical protein [Pedobacter sp. ISL-68]
MISKHATEVSLTRKLRELMGMQEITLSAEEAELYGVLSADLLEPEFMNEQQGENDYE